MKDLRMYQLLEKIGFTRVGGTNKELEAAHILMDEIKTIGGTPYLQEFTVNDQDIHHVSLKDNLGNANISKCDDVDALVAFTNKYKSE